MYNICIYVYMYSCLPAIKCDRVQTKINVNRDLWEMSKGREETSEEPKDTSKSKINGEKRNLKTMHCK